MPRLILALLALVWGLAPAPVAAQQRTPTYEALTVSSTAVGISAATLTSMGSCTAVVETAEVRWRNDGTAPTSSTGTPVAIGTAINFDNIVDASRASFIRTEATDAVIHINCFPNAGAVGVTGSAVSEVDLTGTASTDLSEMADNIETLATNAAVDGQHDQASPTTGPLAHGECDDTSTDAVDEGDSGKTRIDCTTRALVTRLVDPCSGAKTVAVVDIVTAATTELINGAGASNNVYICGVFLGPTAGAQNLTLVEDDSDNCASPTAGLFGGVTAGEGWNMAANGGTNIGNGGFTVGKTTAANRYVCLISSAAQQVSGTIVYVLAP
jgi:hypothetical protein